MEVQLILQVAVEEAVGITMAESAESEVVALVEVRMTPIAVQTVRLCN